MIAETLCPCGGELKNKARSFCSPKCKAVYQPSMLGKKHSDETRTKMSLKAEGKSNHMWKGQGVGYQSLHIWVRRKLGKPLKCSNCGFESSNTHQFHWANKSGKYLRDLTDWIRLCVSCHRAYDKDIRNQELKNAN